MLLKGQQLSCGDKSYEVSTDVAVDEYGSHTSYTDAETISHTSHTHREFAMHLGNLQLHIVTSHTHR